MSRSYKKHPWSALRSPWNKKQANKRVRKYNKPIQNGKAYKKLYCSWNICDYKSRYTLGEWLELEVDRCSEHAWRTKAYDELEAIDLWERYYLRK